MILVIPVRTVVAVSSSESEQTMDLAYWEFDHWPFERSYSASRFFTGSMHEEALARLLFLVEEHRRSGILMGPAGTGKSFLLRMLQHRAERLGRLTVRCDATGIEARELAVQIAMGCHVACEPDASMAKIWNGLNLRLTSMSIVRQSLVVIIDHFDHVHASCVHAIGRLIQLADATGVKLTLIIATRDHQISQALNDFIELKIEIGPWTMEEVAQFVHSAVLHAGSSRELFSNEAISRVCELTQGIPARVVSLCNLALLAACESEESIVGQGIVEGLMTEVLPRGLESHPHKRIESRHQISIS